MARQQYEAARDRSEEAKIAKKLGEMWSLDLRKMPKSYRIDYTVSMRDQDSEIIAVAEVKRRMGLKNTYPTLMISLSKIIAGEQYHHMGFPFYIAIQWSDVFGVHRYDPGKYYLTRWKGRTVQKRDEQDEEPCVFIPISEFTEEIPSPITRLSVNHKGM